MAGAIAELAHNGMAKDFRNFDPASARILLVQAGPRVLPQFDERLSAFARSSLQALGVEVHTDSRVELIDGDGVVVNGERIAAGTVLWAAGVVASPASAWLGAEADRAGRIKVGPDLSVPGHPDIFAIGDTALSSRLGWPTCSRACARGEAGRRLRSLGFASPAARPQTAAAVPLSPPRQPGHDRPQERRCRFWTGEGHRRGGMVALGRRARPFPGRRTQSAFGHARLGLVLLYVRRWSTADHGNRTGSTYTDIPEPSLTEKVSGFGIGVSRHGSSRADEVIELNKAKSSQKARVSSVRALSARMAAKGARAVHAAEAERPVSLGEATFAEVNGNRRDAPISSFLRVRR